MWPKKLMGLVGLCTLAIASPATMANAASLGAPPSPVSASSSSSSTGSANTATTTTTTADVITCYPNVQDPHESHHVPETVNVVATVNCYHSDGLPAAVTYMDMTIQLLYGEYPNGEVVAQNNCSNEGSSYLSCNAATSTCVPGYYYPWVYITIEFPPGYTPQWGYTQGSTGPSD